MKSWLVLPAVLCALPAFASGVAMDAAVAPPLLTFDLAKIPPRTPITVTAVSADGLCSIDIDFSRMEVGAENDDSLSGRVRRAICGRQNIESGFATGSYHLLPDGSAQIDSKVQVVLLVDQ
ncbi:MAG TPA: hypothetical protein VHE37_01750 [Nevskiaceae bacterium]|nr:hypothetical protein [Nevskiaceae bacterium]